MADNKKTASQVLYETMIEHFKYDVRIVSPATYEQFMKSQLMTEDGAWILKAMETFAKQ